MVRRTARVLAVAAALLVGGCGAAEVDDTATDSDTSSTPARPTERDPGVDKYPLGKGDYLPESDPGWVYFRTAAGQSCGIGPIGYVVGCDDVPPDAPPGTNQTVINGETPAAYVRTETPTFTRDVDVLPEGHRLTNGGTRCAVGSQGIVTCEIIGGTHGFVLSAGRGVLW